MALVFCPDCGKQVSEHAEVCPNCGYPIGNFLQPFINSENDKLDEESLVNESEQRECNYESTVLVDKSIKNDNEGQGSELHQSSDTSIGEGSIVKKAKRWKVIAIVLAIAFIATLGVSIAGGIILFEKNNELQSQVDSSESYNDTLRKTINELNLTNSELQADVRKYKIKATFLDEHIVIVGTDKYYYHKYGCPRCDSSTFWAFNSEAAISEGYHRCPYCN